MDSDKFDAQKQFIIHTYGVDPAMEMDGVTVFSFPNGDVFELHTPETQMPWGLNDGVAVGFRVDDVAEAGEQLAAGGAEPLGEIARFREYEYAWRTGHCGRPGRQPRPGSHRWLGTCRAATRRPSPSRTAAAWVCLWCPRQHRAVGLVGSRGGGKRVQHHEYVCPVVAPEGPSGGGPAASGQDTHGARGNAPIGSRSGYWSSRTWTPRPCSRQINARAARPVVARVRARPDAHPPIVD